MASFFPTSTTECYVTKHVRNSEILENDCFEYGGADVAGRALLVAAQLCASSTAPRPEPAFVSSMWRSAPGSAFIFLASPAVYLTAWPPPTTRRQPPDDG